MTNVVERRGIVISTQAGVARVRLSPAAGCAGCGTRNSCASAAAKPQIVDVLLPETALARSEVALTLPESSVLLAALLGYLLPVVGLLAGAVAAVGIFSSDLAAITGAVVGFFLGLIGVRRLSGSHFTAALAPSVCRSNSPPLAGDHT